MLVSDIESDGLLKTVSKFHCATTEDFFTGEQKHYTEETFGEYIKALEAEAAKPDGLVVFHNGIGYDIRALDILKRRYFGKRLNIPRHKVLDTLVMTRLVFSNIKDTDSGFVRSGKLPGKLFGSHSLEAWGYRLGEMKGEYKDDFKADLEARGIPYEEGMEWRECSPSMIEYCKQDVRVTVKLLRKLFADQHYFTEGVGIYAVRLEHSIMWTMAQQMANGFPFDEVGAQELYATLAAERQNILMSVVETFGSWWSAKGGTSCFMHPVTGAPLDQWTVGPYAGQPIPKVKYPKKGQPDYLKSGKRDLGILVAGAPYTPIERITFSPSSRDHIRKVLKDAGWEPTEFTENGAPIVDDETLEGVRVDDPEKQSKIELIRRYLMIQKRIGQLAEGDKAWLSRLDEDGTIHGSINPNGAVTGRATHSFPNLAQVPSGTAEYGPECRALFGAVHIRKKYKGWENAIQLGADASGLELRCLGHFGAPFDGGSYADQVLNGDVHWVNALAAGIAPAGLVRDKHDPLHDEYRGNAKTFIYAFLYGAGDAKIGLIVGGGAKRGKELKKAFLENTPVISDLRDALKGQLVASEKWNQVTKRYDVKWRRRWIKGIDGRKVHVRSTHSALNTLLQSAGGLICKAWVVEVEKLAMEAGYHHGWYDHDGNPGDFAILAWVHDELQIACRTQEIAEHLGALCQQAIRNVQEQFNFRVTLDTEFKIGPTWRECH